MIHHVAAQLTFLVAFVVVVVNTVVAAFHSIERSSGDKNGGCDLRQRAGVSVSQTQEANDEYVR